MLRNQFGNSIKSNQLFIRLGVMFALIVSLTACGKAAETKDTSEEGGSVVNNLGETIGGKSPIEVKEELIADEVQTFEVDSSYRDQITQIVEGKGKYRKQHEELVQHIKELVGNEDNADFEIFGESKVYISMIPIFYWNCIDNRIMYSAPKIIVFSEDFSKTAVCEFYQEAGTYSFMGFSDGIDPSVKETLEEHPKQDFILVADADTDFLISDKNEIFGAVYHKISVTGEYYQAIKSTGIQLSLKDLTSDKNLVELDV